KEPGEPNNPASAGGRSVWYRWTAPGSGSATFNTIGSAFDTILAVYQGNAVNALGTQLVFNDDINTDAGDVASTVTFTANAGQTYQIAVDGYRNGPGADTGAIKLNW